MSVRPFFSLRQWDGPLTSDLVLKPGDFGLGRVPNHLKPDRTTTMVCGYCSTGCGLKVHLKAGQAINLSPDPLYPVNLGMACPKGWEALAPLDASDRALTPLYRATRGGTPESISWVRAMSEFTSRMKKIQERYGGQSIAVLSTGQICTEEMALLGSLFKFGMGGTHLDSNTRQCMATANVAYKQSFGFDAPPYTYADFEESDALIFFGSNPCIAHPILWQRVLRNRRKPEIVVVDPRRTETAMQSSLHLAITPKSDLILLYGLAKALMDVGAIQESFVENHTTGFAEFADFVKGFSRERVCASAGILPEAFDRLVKIISTRERVSFWWTMGINQGHESTRTAQAIINLTLMTGQIGRPGTGANSITGQCNAMGSRLFGNAASLLGGRDFTNSEHRSDVATILGVGESTIPTTPSWAYDQIIDGIESGDIRGLWVIATNTSHSWIDQKRFQRLVGKLDFLVVQDLFSTTETAQCADLILPAAGWGEKEGTFINSERRFGLIKKVRRAPGEALSDFAIFRLVAASWGCDGLFREWSTPEAVFQILKRLSAGRPCDINGIRDYQHLDESGGIQWPCPILGLDSPPAAVTTDSPWNQRRLFADGNFFTQDGRANFYFEEPRPPEEIPCPAYPFTLLTGRGTSSQWHTNSRTEKSDVLRKLYPQECYVEIHPDDARRLGVANHVQVRIKSRRGELLAGAFLTATVQPGQLFVPMHYYGVNALTHPSFDPHSRQPSYKMCAVMLELA